MVLPVSFASHSRKRLPHAGLLCVFALTLCAGAAVLRAQDTLPPDSQYPSAPVPAPAAAPAPALALTPTPAPAPADVDAAPAAASSPSSPGLKAGSSGSAHGRGAPRNAGQGLSFWDSTPADAIHQGGGARTSRSSTPGGQPDDLESLFQGTNGPSSGHRRGFGGVGPGMNGAHGSAPGDLKLNQLSRGDLGMYLRSSVGSFRLTYRDALGARSNGMGGGVGQGSAGVSFNSSTFGNGMFNFSASTMMGSGPGSGSMRPMGGAGLGSSSAPGGAAAHPAASVSLHLHF